jgi:nicotinamidase-related amidase
MNTPTLSEPGAGEGLADWIAPGRTALLAIDMQVDFASPKGALAAAGADLTDIPAALVAAERLVTAARAAKAPVIFLNLTTDPAHDSAAWRTRLIRRGGSAGDIAICRAGSPGAAFAGPAPLPGEPRIAKRRYSGFVGTDLDQRLKALGVDTIVACGLTTECCVDCTVRDAFHLDYHVFIAGDACATYDRALHEAALRSLDLNCAIVTDTAAIAAAWATHAS